MHFILKARPMRRWRVRIFNSNISLLFPPDTFIVTFAGALQQALAYLVCSRHVAGHMVTKTHNLHVFLNIAV